MFQHSASLSIFLSKSEIELNLNLVGNKPNPLFIGFIFRALMELSGYVIPILIKTTMWVFTIWQDDNNKKTTRFHF